MVQSLRRILRCTAAALAVSATFVAPAAHAQGAAAPFPSRPVTLVVPFTPNSGSDIIARIVGPKLSARWGQPVVVDNKPGASGNIGANAVAKAAPDGHTLLMAINTFTITPALYKPMPFDALGDFSPITQLASATFGVAVNPDLPVKDMSGLISHLKRHSGQVNYASPGKGTPHHLAMELFKQHNNLDVLHVAYKGISQALTDLMGGQVQVMFGSLPSVRSYSEAGRLRLIGVTGNRRSPLAPAVPTFKEQGIDYLEGVDAWYAVLGPARLPKDLADRLQQDFAAVMNSEDVKAELGRQGLTVQTGGPVQLGTLIRSDMARWQKVVSTAGITGE